MGHDAYRLSGSFWTSISHLLKRSRSFGYVSPKKATEKCTRSSLWKLLGRTDVPAHIVSCSRQQKALTAPCFSFPLQAIPVWSLLPVFLPTFGAEEPRSYTLQRQAFQVWLLWSCLCWCHNSQQSHPDTHWGEALQVSTWI